MPRQPHETMEGFLIRTLRDEVLEQAATAAEANAPDNEQGEYWKGRRDAAGTIRSMISETQNSR